MNPAPPARIAAIAATYRRVALLRRLCESLGSQKSAGEFQLELFLADNDADPQVAAAAAELPVPTHYLAVPGNPGCGAGLRKGMEAALERDHGWTHFLILDDDATLEPDCVANLVQALQESGAGAAVPLILDDQERITSFPGLLASPGPWKSVRAAATAAEYVRDCGPAPVPFTWAPGVCLMVTRASVDQLGLHRPDFWMLGEDLEYSMRITSRLGGVFVPTAVAHHLPPRIQVAGQDEAKARRWREIKELAHLRNSAYAGFRLPHCRPLLRHLPGNTFRFWKSTGFRPGVLWRVFAHVLAGAVLGRPAGHASFTRMRERGMAAVSNK